MLNTFKAMKLPLSEEASMLPSEKAIVVLGAAVRPDGTPSPSLRRRIDHAKQLFDTGRAGFIVGSGGLGDFPPTEAKVIRDVLIAHGVPAKAIFQEGRSRSTFENAHFSIQLMRTHGIRHAVVVTDSYHLLRSIITFRLLGMPATGSSPRGGVGTSKWKWALYHVRECAALPYYVGKAIWWRLVKGVVLTP